MYSARLARRWQEASGDYARMPEALNDEITEELATKADLLALEAALKTEIAEARVDLGGEIAGLRAEVAAARGHLEAKAESVRAQIIKWVGGIATIQIVAIVGLVRLLFIE